MQESTNFFLKGLDSIVFGFAVRRFSGKTTQLCPCKCQSRHRQYVNNCVWLWSIKTLSTKAADSHTPSPTPPPSPGFSLLTPDLHACWNYTRQITAPGNLELVPWGWVNNNYRLLSRKVGQTGWGQLVESQDHYLGHRSHTSRKQAEKPICKENKADMQRD